MSRPIKPIPTYRQHKPSGKAIVTVRTQDGGRKDIILPGAYGSHESQEEYQRILALLRTSGGCYLTKATADITVNELALRFLQEKVAVDYPDTAGEPHPEQERYRSAIRVLCRLWGSTVALELDCQRLETVQEAMATGSWLSDKERAFRDKRKRPHGWARKTVNDQFSRLRAMLRWGARRKLIPATVLAEAQVVESLRRGRGKAREMPLVTPVDPAIVDATLPHLPAVVADMVRMLILTGMRVGELCLMRVGDLENTSEPVWFFRPRQHKNLHRGHVRVIAIGPQAQMILRRYLKPNVESYLFSPAEQRDIISIEKRAARKTPIQPSQVNRRKANPKRKPGEHFTSEGVNRAIARACRLAKVEKWHVHQLRHTAALLIEREHGAEGARATLGHRTLNMTLHYSGIDAKRAAQVALAMG